MKFTEIASRITGLSCPLFGAQWNPPEAERSIARRVITYLEDKRVLYEPAEFEVPAHCIESVLQIRGFLTSELSKLSGDTDLALSLRAMRAACRKFLSTVRIDDQKRVHISRHIVNYGEWMVQYASWVFSGILGEMRGVFGIHIARLAAAYGLDVEDQLASILPEPAEDN